jgi:hypothetical protein
MKELTIICDRCKKEVVGIIDEDVNGRRMTGGYYDVSGGCWARYARCNETQICDQCMFSDHRYQEIYGVMRSN